MSQCPCTRHQTPNGSCCFSILHMCTNNQSKEQKTLPKGLWRYRAIEEILNKVWSNGIHVKCTFSSKNRKSCSRALSLSFNAAIQPVWWSLYCMLPSGRGFGLSRPPSCISSKEKDTLCTYRERTCVLTFIRALRETHSPRCPHTTQVYGERTTQTHTHTHIH